MRHGQPRRKESQFLDDWGDGFNTLAGIHGVVVSSAAPDFEAVYRDGFSYVYRVLRYLGADDADIEDLAHDVFVVVHRRLDDYDLSRPFRPWLFGITYRTLRRHRERGARREALDAKNRQELPVQASAEEQVAEFQSWQRLQTALQELSYDQRAVVIMHDVEEHTAPEIATELELSVNTVYSRLRLARKRLAKLLRAEGSL